MSPRTTGVLCLVLSFPGLSPAQNLLDLIPADASAAVVIRNLDDLQTKGDKFVAEANMAESIRPSQWFKRLYDEWQFNSVIDTKGSAAILLVSEQAAEAKIANFIGALTRFVVLVIPFSDEQKLAENLGVPKGKLQQDKIIPLPNVKKRSFCNFACVRGKHVYLADYESTLKGVLNPKRLRTVLSAERQKHFERSDVLVHFGRAAMQDLHQRNPEESLPASWSREEVERFKEITTASTKTEFVLGGIRIDDGLGVSLYAPAPEKGADEVRALLGKMRAGEGVSTLRGLPEGDAVFVQATGGDGALDSLTARVLFRYLLDWLPGTSRAIIMADRPVFLNVFQDVWQRLKGTRLAVYRCGDPVKHGLFSAVAILDATDPAQLMDELRQFARFAGKLDLTSEVGKQANAADVEKLVRDLGARRFAQRQSAELKLLLLGEPALLFLEPALKSSDLETAKRAERIKHEIVQAAEWRRKELLNKELTAPLRPQFQFLATTETLEGSTVAHIGVGLKVEDAARVPQMRQLLGPEWNRIRVAVQGSHVVVLVGSEVALLRQALTNLKHDRAGLAAAQRLEQFNAQSSQKRKIEGHVSLAAVDALLNATNLRKPGLPTAQVLSSVSITIEADRLQLEMWIPSTEMKCLKNLNP